ncbi:MAG: hypothetical protein ACI8XM_001456 [Haloarculaceae archaeon]|jgi:hypothetical protein
MSDQQYVYTTYETEVQRRGIGDLEAVVNEYASEGWRVSETLEEDGTTVGLLFERKV